MADKIIPLDDNATPANSKAGGTIAGSYKGVIAPVAKEARENNPDSNAGYKNELKRKGITVPTSDPKGYNVKSIQQAYYDGTIDKSTRDYMMADAIAKFARNIGRDIGNIGAQFTGGSIDNNREEALWDSRNKELFGNKITAETAQQEGTEANIQRQKDILELEKANKGLSASRLMSSYKDEALAKAKELEKDKNKVGAEIMRGVAGEFALLETGSLSDVGTEEHVANALAAIAKGVAAGIITEEDASKWKSELADVASVNPTVNVNIGSLFGGGNGDDDDDGLTAYEREMAKAAEKVNKQALQSGKRPIGDLPKENVKQQLLQGLDNQTKLTIGPEFDKFFDNMYFYGGDKWTVDGAIELAKQYAVSKLKSLSPEAQEKIKSDAANQGWYNK